MKKSLNQLLAFGCVVLLILSSCKKDGTKAVMPSTSTGGAITASATSLMLTKAQEAETAVTFEFQDPNFGYQAAAINTMQIGVKGSNFVAAKEIALPAKVKSKTYTVLDFNALLLTLGLPFDSATDIEVRVKSEVTPSVAPVYSNVLTLNVKPYPLITRVYVPGNYQGWNPPTADSLTSATGNGIHTGIIYFPANPDNNYEFKITPQKKWDVAYGDAGGGTISTSAGGNLKAPGAGSYLITVDMNLLTIEIKQDSWAIIGSAAPGGWSPAADNDMIYNNTNSTWSATIAFVPGEFKFRYNDAWTSDYGGEGGVIKAGGKNIAIADAGNYKVVLDIPNGTYTVTKL